MPVRETLSAMKALLLVLWMCVAGGLRAGEDEERASQLVRDLGGSLIFVEDRDGAGSGFVCVIAGRKFALTNQHVIAGRNSVAFTLLDGSALKVGQAAAAVGHDIMSFAVFPDVKGMEMMTEVDRNVAIGDAVAVLGNPEGARVIKPLVGKIVGIGPNLVEVDAAFVPGNSGSPIVHLKTGKVVGVATYLMLREVDALTGRRAPQIRRFGFRIDSVKQWQPVVWPVYNEEFQVMKKVEARTHDLGALLTEMGRTGRINAAKHQNPAIRGPLEKFDKAAGSAQLNATDRVRALKDLMAAMRTACQSDIEQAQARIRYDFFRKSLGDEQKVRGEFYKIFDELMKMPAK